MDDGKNLAVGHSLLISALDPYEMNLGQHSMYYYLTSVESHSKRRTMMTFCFLWYRCQFRSSIQQDSKDLGIPLSWVYTVKWTWRTEGWALVLCILCVTFQGPSVGVTGSLSIDALWVWEFAQVCSGRKVSWFSIATFDICLLFPCSWFLVVIIKSSCTLAAGPSISHHRSLQVKTHRLSFWFCCMLQWLYPSHFRWLNAVIWAWIF